MKTLKLFSLLAVLMFATSMMAQTAQSTTALSRDGNTYYKGDTKLTKSQVLDFYAQQNCQAAYDEFAKGLKKAKTGWALLGVGAALDVAAISCSVAYLTKTPTTTSGSTPSPKLSDPLYAASLGLVVGALAFEIACIPTLVSAYKMQHNSVDVYNVECAKAQARTYWSVQSSQNGLGLALNF